VIDATAVGMLRMLLGEDVYRLLQDPEVSEVYVNADLRVRTDGAGGRRHHPQILDRDRLMGFFSSVASEAGLLLDEAHPIRDFELPEAFGFGRLHVKVPPVVMAPVFNLRKRPTTLHLLPALVAFGCLDAAIANYLSSRVRDRASILIAGPTNSGKTNFLNALLHEAVDADPAARFVVLEDVPEIVCPAADTQVARTSDSVSLWDLVRATMRSSPDRIVVGELRGAEAYPFLDIASSGHPGVLATVHAETPLGALQRVNRLAKLASPDLPDQGELIAEVLQVVVCLSGTSRGRRVSAIAELHGWSPTTGFLLNPPALPASS
jgi:type IV secretion system protein TrbB